jgi:site-specific DNA recombinase
MLAAACRLVKPARPPPCSINHPTQPTPKHEQVTAATQIVEETIEAIERKIHRFTSNRILASMSVDATLREEWDKGDLDWRRSLLALIIERVVVHPCGRTEVRYRPRQDDPREWRFDPEKIEIVWKV